MCSGDMATQYERVRKTAKSRQTEPTQTTKYVVGDWDLLQDNDGTPVYIDAYVYK